MERSATGAPATIPPPASATKRSSRPLLQDEAALRALRAASAERLAKNTVVVAGADGTKRTFAVAAGALYPHQWSWDAAFVAMGLAHVDVPRAMKELESLFGGQWQNGKLPHIVYNPTAARGQYFPDPARWDVAGAAGARGPSPGAPETSGIIQPPVHALAALEIWEQAAQQGGVVEQDARRDLAALYPKLVAWHEFLMNERDPEGSGLVTIVHPWESGTDNSPRWDEAMQRIVVGDMPAFERADLKHADPSQRPTQADYDRYLWLVEKYKQSGYDDKAILAPDSDYPFRIKDVVMSAILVRANDALAQIADVVGAPAKDRERLASYAARGRAGLARQWDPKLRGTVDQDVVTDQPVRVRTIAHFAPLIAGGLDAEKRKTQLALLDSKVFCGHPTLARPLPPTTSPLDERFDPKRYWRGPSWPIMSWIISRGLEASGAPQRAQQLVQEALGQVRDKGPAEYFDVRTDEALGSPVQTWTDAFVVAETSRALQKLAPSKDEPATAIGRALAAGDMSAARTALAPAVLRLLHKNRRVVDDDRPHPFVQRSEVGGGPIAFTVPAEGTYGQQSWEWDLAFGALVARELAQDATDPQVKDALRTLDEGSVRAIFQNQRGPGKDRGLVPHMNFVGGVDEKLWGHPHRSFITQPPVFPRAVLGLQNAALRQALYPAVREGLDFWLRERLDDDGLPFVVHPWETGLDAARYNDSQQAPMAAFDLWLRAVGMPALRAAGIDAVADAGAARAFLARRSRDDGLQALLPFDVDAVLAAGDLLALQTKNAGPKDEAQKRARFIGLAALKTLPDDARSVFQLKSTDMASMLVMGLDDGARLAREAGADGDAARFTAAAAAMRAAVTKHMRDPDDGIYRSIGRRPDARLADVVARALPADPSRETMGAIANLRRAVSEVDAQGRIAPKVGSAFLVLTAGIARGEDARRLLDHLEAPEFQSAFGLPTSSRADAAFKPDDYWRGSVWINVNVYVVEGLVRAARDFRSDGDEESAHRAAALAVRIGGGTLQAVSGGFHEYYDADTGAGLGPRDFTWSALAYGMTRLVEEANGLLGRPTRN